MPDFEIVSIADAKLQTSSGRRGEFINEYVGHIRQLTTGQAGKLHIFENENPATIRRRLIVAAKMLGIDLVIKRSGQDIYFWTAELETAKPGPRRGGRRRRQAETETPEQYFSETGELAQEQTEESPAIGNGEQGESGDAALD
jgi:hypothetical protein